MPRLRRRDTLLIVDDDPELLDLFDIAFGPSHRVLTATDGRTALELLGDDDVDAIVSDLVMPEMDGLEFVREVRSRGFDIPCLLLSASPPERGEHLADAKLFAILQKPCSVGVLRAACSSALERDRQRSNWVQPPHRGESAHPIETES